MKLFTAIIYSSSDRRWSQLSQLWTCGPPRLSGVTLHVLQLPVSGLNWQPFNTHTVHMTSPWCPVCLMVDLVDGDGGGCRSMNSVDEWCSFNCFWCWIMLSDTTVFILKCWGFCPANIPVQRWNQWLQCVTYRVVYRGFHI